VEILLKEGKFHNEMNCYRYDVILYIDHDDKKPSEKVTWKSWNTECRECLNLDTIHSILSQDTPHLSSLAIKNIPNNRTAALTYLLNDSHFSSLENWYGAFETYLGKYQSKALDPEVFYEIASEHGYHASITWSARNPSEFFDVVFVKKHKNNIPKEYLSLLEKRISHPKQHKSWNHYANLPLLPRINRKLISEVKSFLQARLPYYMIPSYFVPIKELPITANGKIDRKALPVISHPLAEKEYIKPYTDTQKKLVSLWQKILGIQNIGIRHNFYDLGGTSLLAIQLIISIHKAFGVDLSLQKLQELAACTLNIENLSSLIETGKTVLRCESANTFSS
jgi:microcystin synthetase protein McyA